MFSTFDGLEFDWLFATPKRELRDGLMVISGSTIVYSHKLVLALQRRVRPISVQVAGDPNAGGAVYVDHWGDDPARTLVMNLPVPDPAPYSYLAVLTKMTVDTPVPGGVFFCSLEFTLLQGNGVGVVILRRQVMAQITIGSEVVTDFLSVHVSNVLQQQIAKAEIVCAAPHGDFNDDVEILLGTSNDVTNVGNRLAPRFRGYRRTIRWDLYPNTVTIECVGRLAKAAEYINGEDSGQQGWSQGSGAGALGGLIVMDLVPSSPYMGGLAATAADIIRAVLRKAGVLFDDSDIQGTGRTYGFAIGNIFNLTYLWKAGTVSAAQLSGYNSGGGVFQQAGESALAYIQKYNQVEAKFVVVGHDSDGNEIRQGGFYRLFENLDGRILCVLMGGRPRGSLSVDPGSLRPMIFTDGGSPATAQPFQVNVLTASYHREMPSGNRTLVTGAQIVTKGQGVVHYEEAQYNVYHGNGRYYDPSPPSSNFIDWPDRNLSNRPPGFAEFGQDCETVAKARILEVNRITVEGELTTCEDWLCAPTQTHLVQSPSGSTARLGIGEKVWCRGVEVELSLTDDGAPVLRQRLTHIGGGLPDTLALSWDPAPDPDLPPADDRSVTYVISNTSTKQFRGASESSFPPDWAAALDVFDDAAWLGSVEATIGSGQVIAAGSLPIWTTAVPESDTEQVVFRHHFETLPNSILSVSFEVIGDDQVADITLNGNPLAAGIGPLDFDNSTQIFDLPPEWFALGVENVIALRGINLAADAAFVSFNMVIVYGA